MADLDWLFGNQAPSSFTATTTEQANMPSWWQEASRSLISKASGIANEPYSPYAGPRVAGLDPLQQQAMQGAETAGQAGGGTLGQAANLASTAGNTQFDPAQFQQFMSPYTEGVVDRIAELGQRNLSENLLPQVNQSFIGSGMPFGSRHADFTARALRDANESILGQQANALQTSYDSAMGNYQNALQRQAQTGGILAGIGTGQTQNELQAGGYQNIMGDMGRELGQRNLDVAYSDFQNQQNYPREQLDLVNSILRGYSPTASRTGTTTNPIAASQTTNPTGGALSALGSFFGSK
jgi:hypothetical protein